MINFDCHAHVYETVKTVPDARYVPNTPAPLATWVRKLEKHSLRGGVIVQVSFLGTDNTELCSALSKLSKQLYAGVAVVELDVDDNELDRLFSVGVRGVRWNLVRGKPVPDLPSEEVQAFFDKLRHRNMHLEVHLEGQRLAGYIEQLADQSLNLVIDHFGLPSDPNPANDPLFRAINSLHERENIYLKLSASYRTNFDLSSHLDAIKNLLPTNRVVWGSDWPHTQHEHAITYEMTYSDTRHMDDICDLDAVEKLYGISIF